MRHYFEAHQIIEVTDKPLMDIFTNKEASSRISKWSSEFSRYIIIDFRRRNAIRSQVLADFVTDLTVPKREILPEMEKQWTIYCDGAYCN